MTYTSYLFEYQGPLDILRLYLTILISLITQYDYHSDRKYGVILKPISNVLGLLLAFNPLHINEMHPRHARCTCVVTYR